MNKITSLTSEDLVAQNIATLKQLFPTIVKEGEIDFKELESLLKNDLVEGDEYYRFTWAGKSQARLEANKPSTATLRPDKESSKNWDTTKNIFIEGDNLEVLKLLQKSYANRIKMIYIDPPYNTGKDFVYMDNYADNLQNYLDITGQTDAQGKKTSTNTESDGRYHSNWLNMMYPRLRLARNLLTDDGVIFISIDDNEVHNLRKLCDEVFGEENFVECLKWKRKKQPSFLARHTAKVMEYVLIYAKSFNKLEKLSIEGTSDSTKKVVNLTNQYSERFFKKGVMVKSGGSGIIKKGKYQIKTMTVEYLDDVIYEEGFTTNDVSVFAQFSVSQEKIDNYIDEKLLFITINNGLRRDVSEEEIGKKKSITDLLLDWGDNQDSDNEMKEIFEEKYFDYTKPLKFMYNLSKSSDTENNIILDFFAGSGTTAHAVMQLNAEDGGNRKCISVQLPELTDESSEAFKAGYTNIAEITKERIRRAGEKIVNAEKENLQKAEAELSAENAKAIKDENLIEELASKIQNLKSKIQNLDIGFKAFKLDSSNIRPWDGNPENLEDQLFTYAENIKENRTEEDILFEVLLKYGLDLTVPIEEKAVAGKTVYNIGAGTMFICLADNITPEISEAIGQWKEELQPAISRVIFKDSGFATDKDKTNAVQILKRFGVEEANSI
ncbi:site-specific DNA-methyltransferase [Chryseobacterium sp.]|uniref:site-specific DNA-methyltransferase n=1 Tax=Chryseobacterium sp. TaxID=1871047 RepID=UPI0012A8E6F1|nr:site-specific DNA-methyltransferase [Chryseobacterium sp.]QFG53542.1 site-specific DNA-methyltransferase [Chryseobacterium sp.]